MDASTITSNTFVLRNPINGSIVASKVNYNASTNVATLTPTQPLAAFTTYTATITGGKQGVMDVAGNALASDLVWSFTTGDGSGCPCTIWPASATPAQIAANDPSAVELGAPPSDTGGTITGVLSQGSDHRHARRQRWTNNGALLATATFTTETASGWQDQLAAPVTLTANTTYVCRITPTPELQCDWAVTSLRPAWTTRCPCARQRRQRPQRRMCMEARFRRRRSTGQLPGRRRSPACPPLPPGTDLASKAAAVPRACTTSISRPRSAAGGIQGRPLSWPRLSAGTVAHRRPPSPRPTSPT
jgi:hypothetical protein